MISNYQESNWEGFRRIDYCYKKNQITIVFPDRTPNKKWVWRTEFFGAFPSADIEMLNKGYVLAHYSISDMYGSPDAVRKMDEFYSHITSKLNLSKRAILFGFSRGGLYALNFAHQFPKRISAIYFDAPVIDIHSWPEGKYTGVGNQKLWQECMKAYGYTSIKEAEEYSYIDKFETLLKYNIPIIIVAGDSDKTVPFSENSALFEEYYEKNGGHIKVILKNGVGHHPHSLKDPQEIVKFLVDKGI